MYCFLNWLNQPMPELPIVALNVQGQADAVPLPLFPGFVMPHHTVLFRVFTFSPDGYSVRVLAWSG